MQYAIEILQTDLYKVKEAKRNLERFELSIQQNLNSESLNISEESLRKAVAHLQSAEQVESPATDRQHTQAKMPSWEIAIKDVVFNTREERDIAATIYENVARHFGCA